MCWSRCNRTTGRSLPTPKKRSNNNGAFRSLRKHTVSSIKRYANPRLTLTERELLLVLERHDIQQINPVGEKLDPNLHQAMVQVDHPEAPAGTIIDVLQVGYVLHDRLLRPAMVAVAKGPEGGNGDSLDAGQTIDTTA